MFNVGIADWTCAVRIPEKEGGVQQTVASISLEVEITARQTVRHPAERVRELLASRLPDIHSGMFPELLAAVRQQLDSRRADIVMRFPYFIRKTAPQSGTVSLMEYHCAFTAGDREEQAAPDEPGLCVTVPVTTLCPCSKEISDSGAHNQRAAVTLAVQPKKLIWLEDLIALAESCGSSEVYALLKRPDEKFVTEWAYAHPMFVEDVARKVAQKLAAHPDVSRFSVSVESFESIHSHNAFALVDSDSF